MLELLRTFVYKNIRTDALVKTDLLCLIGQSINHGSVDV
jgi:hypothetical protein